MRVWPLGVALQGEASNHLMLRWLKTVVVSDEEKAHVMRQVGTGKASGSEPLLKRRNQIRWHRNRGDAEAPGWVWRVPADWPGGVRRERRREPGLRLLHGTWEGRCRYGRGQGGLFLVEARGSASDGGSRRR